MKTILLSTLAIALALTGTLRASNLQAQTNAAPVRIGTYDSRAVAYAWFCSSNQMRQLHEQIKEAKAAKACGDTQRYHQLRSQLPRLQKQIMREVFGTAPAVEALAEIKDDLPEIQEAAGVNALVSKWDNAALKKYPGAERVDVTDRLVQEFKPTEKQLKMILEIEKSKPSHWIFL
jgi:hypothetical protein